MIRTFLEFVLGNFTLTFFAVGLLFSAVAIARVPKRVSSAAVIEKLLSWSLRTKNLLQRSCCRALGLPSGAWEERVVRLVEAVLAGWPGITARPVSHGHSREGAAT